MLTRWPLGIKFRPPHPEPARLWAHLPCQFLQAGEFTELPTPEVPRDTEAEAVKPACICDHVKRLILSVSLASHAHKHQSIYVAIT